MSNQEPRTKNQRSEYGYRNLVVWQKAQDLALEIIRLTAALPRNPANDVITRQIVRAASSIAANIAEGHARFTPRAYANHLSIAKGSAAETDSWLDLLQRSGGISPEDERRLHHFCRELMAMLTARMRELERVPTNASRELREEPSEYEF